MEITSLQNDKVKYFQKLNDKKFRDQEKLFLVEGMHLFNEAKKHNIIKEVITDNKDFKCDYKTYYVTSAIMKKLSNQVTGTNVIAVCKFLDNHELGNHILVLDNIQDPGNLGTMIRSAVAFSFDTIFLSNDTVDLYNPKVIRSSEGMIFHINIIRGNIIEFLSSLDKSYLKITTDVKDGEDVNLLDTTKCALVIGNEGSGVKKEVESLCDKKVNIKMNNNCESLNAGVSASILMYEVFK